MPSRREAQSGMGESRLHFARFLEKCGLEL